MKHQTLLIGLDGATFSILDSLMQDGTMPFLKEFVDSGVRAKLRSVIPPLTPPAWTSLVTGRNPGHHGIFDFFLKEKDSPHIRFASSQDVKRETIWSIASRMSRRVTTLNFPLLLPPPEINGNVISGGWMTWRQLRLGCHPQDLYDRIKTLPGFNPRKLAMDMSHEEKAIEGCRPEEYEDWIRFHIRREHQWYGILKYLMNEDPADLTAILFDGMDKIQHLGWQFLAPQHPNENLSSWEQRIRSLFLEYFQQLDGLLAQIFDLTGGDATILIASDHGFCLQTETFFINTWLERNGYLHWADDSPPAENELAVMGIGHLARHVYTLDWDRTKAYAATPSSNGIHIVTAEDNQGKGVPRSEYESFREELKEALCRVISPVTGKPVVRRIWTREEAFRGAYMAQAPDLTLSLRDDGFISILASDEPVKARTKPSGTHHPEGVFIARGPGIASGATVATLSILDVAPVLLYTLGLQIPENMEGRMPEELFTNAYLERYPVRTGERSEPVAPDESEGRPRVIFDAEAEAEMAKRLRDLGYIE